MTCIACLLALFPFWYGGGRSKGDKQDENSGHDQANGQGDNVQEDQVRLYRHQLHELEKEHAQGVMSDKEMEVARTEVARRLLAVVEESGQKPSLSSKARR